MRASWPGFKLVFLDPNWSFRNNGTRGAAIDHYATSKVSEICAEVAPLTESCAPDALAVLWTPSAMLITGEAAQVARAAGFEPKQLFVWLKVSRSGAPRIGSGNYFRNALEPAIICSRGKGSQLIADLSIANWIETGEFGDAPPPEWIKAERHRHSGKPEGVQTIFERLVGANAPDASSRLELYARRMRPGWTCLGNELPNGGGPS